MGQFPPTLSYTTPVLKPNEEYGGCLVFFFFFLQLAELFNFCNSRGDDFLIIFYPVHANAIIKQQVPARRLDNQCYSWTVLEMWFLMSVTIVLAYFLWLQ